jgi:hypothetical protein
LIILGHLPLMRQLLNMLVSEFKLLLLNTSSDWLLVLF